ncbi:MAG: hypothetical protein ACLP3K_00190 [Candidatus Acidiferrales bacterium]
MSKDTASTRRSFLKRGALLAAPLAAVAAPAAILADDELKARLAKLENEAAIRELHQAWLRRITVRKDETTGEHDAAAALFANREGAFDPSVRRIAPDHSAQPDAIEVAADGKRATGRFHCAVEIETAIPQDSTLAQMAHAQGSGFVRRTERRILKVEYVKASGAWAIARAELAPV